MRVTFLRITNLRAVASAELHFQPGFNLIVGVNGVGKTSILDALCVCLSPVLRYQNQIPIKIRSFSVDDIRVGTDVLTAECRFEIGSTGFRYLYHLPRKKKRTNPRISNFLGSPPQQPFEEGRVGRPLAVMFATRRAITSTRTRLKEWSAGGVTAAYAYAFQDHELQLGEFAAWMKVQKALLPEKPAAENALSALEHTVQRFLPGYSNIRLFGEARPHLVIDRGGKTIKVRQLSDGERGSLALVLDLTRRLAQANPKMEDPAANAEAVVLIDEIDLHLHPKWQRQITQNLTATFPKCQFIATTHSPQVVAAVEPEQVLLLTATEVVHPDRTLGMDSNWILRHLMETDDRPAGSALAIRTVESFISKGAFTKARTAIAKAKKKGFDLPEWSVLEARMARLRELR